MNMKHQLFLDEDKGSRLDWLLKIGVNNYKIYSDDDLKKILHQGMVT